MKKLFSYLMMMCFSMSAFATHIVGGEIYYECKGGDSYEIILKIYLDGSSSEGFDPTSAGGPYVHILDSAQNFLFGEMMGGPVSTQTIVNTINTPCIDAPTGVTVREGIFKKTVTLPYRPGGYKIVYQRCCRNNSITNIDNPAPSKYGSTYEAWVSDSTLMQCNNSPYFKTLPPVYICSSFPLDYDHSAIDPDGDSLVYELCSPYYGASKDCPSPRPGLSDPSCSAEAEPYDDLPFINPYTYSAPMSANPALAIDPQTGLLTGTPDALGQYVVGVCVKEYRDGILIGVGRRDFQFNVVSCPSIRAAIDPQSEFCEDLTIDFTNNSLDASTYSWDFGDGNTSTQTIPSHTYSQPGEYVIELIAEPGDVCADTTFDTIQVYVGAQAAFSQSNFCELKVDFTNSTGATNVGYAWDFGESGNADTSSVESPSYTYGDTGTYTTTLITNPDNLCADTVTQTIQVYLPPVITFNAPAAQCWDPSGNTFDFNLSGNYTNTAGFEWGFGDAGSSIVENPSYSYSDTGTYQITIDVRDKGCSTQANGAVRVHPVPVAIIASSKDEICIPFLVEFYDSTRSADPIISYDWDFGDGSTSTDQNPTNTYTQDHPASGFFDITLSVATAYCSDDTSFSIGEDVCLIEVPNVFTPNGDGVNDNFVIVNLEFYPGSRLQIYNRWGRLMYESDDYKNDWNGGEVSDGTYFYVLFQNDDDVITESTGYLTLMRGN